MSTPSTSLSTRVDAELKADFIRRAGEVGVPPSQLLKQIVEEFLERPKTEGELPDKAATRKTSTANLEKLMRFASQVGEYNSKQCGYNQNGICTYWYWEESPTKLDSVPVMTEKGKFRVHANPLYCAFCVASRPEINKLVSEVEAKIQSVSHLKDKLWDVHRRLGKLELRTGERSICPECFERVEPDKFEEHWREKHSEKPSWW